MHFYNSWGTPTIIISDGPYGIGGYKGDPTSPELLAEWYEPHVIEWAKHSTPRTTLWFWNTEIGWATVHPILLKHGWQYVQCNIWDKGISHVAGNVNTKTIRRFPVVTEVCVHYVRRPEYTLSNGNKTPTDAQTWLRSEWLRSGLPLSRANEACGVKNAASRKYLTADHLWYYPPAEMFDRLVSYANKHGEPSGRPYFSMDGLRPMTGGSWELMRSVFKCPVGITNVWSFPPVRGSERIKQNGKNAHPNQKPLDIMELLINSTSEKGDLVWEPFGGLCTASVAAVKLGRHSVASELDKNIYTLAKKRLIDTLSSLHVPTSHF